MSASRENRHQAEEAAQPTEDKGMGSLLHRLRCWAEPALWSVLVALAGIVLAAGLGVRP
jgi:hypothetical protein